MVAARIVQQGVGHIPRLQYVERGLLTWIAQRLGPLAQRGDVTALQTGLAAARVSTLYGAAGNDRHAGQARTGAGAQRAGCRLAQGIQRGVSGILVGHCHHDDGDFFNLLRGQRAGLVVHSGGLEPALEVGAKRGSGGPASAFGDGYLVRVAQVKGQVGT